MYERLVDKRTRQLLEQADPGSLKRYVDRFLIPQMNQARGRIIPMNDAEIWKKMYDTDPNKVGEMIEFASAVLRKRKQGRCNKAEIALEIADLVYYTRQPSAFWAFKKKHIPFLDWLGLTYIDALQFCALKYSIRLKNQLQNAGKIRTHREEDLAMQSFLANHYLIKFN